jgi:hypothetical protein
MSPHHVKKKLAVAGQLAASPMRLFTRGLPCAKGAFFGMQIREKLPEGHRHPFSITISKKAPEFLDLSLNNPNYALMSFINTFVDTDELRPSQRSVCDQVLALIKKHEGALTFSLLSRIMLPSGEHDDLALNARFQRHGLDVAILDYQRLVSSSDWLAAVRLPSEGVFKKYVDMQQRHEMAANGSRTQ